MSAARPCLARLARRSGIVERFHDLAGLLREASDSSREAVLAAMGRDGSSEEAARLSLEALERKERERLLEPVAHWREHDWERPTTLLRTPFEGGTARVALELVEESGARHRRELALPLAPGGAPLRLALPARPPPGLHELRLELELGYERRSARQLYVCAPRTALRARELLGERPAFGVSTNLWSLRGADDSGHGDFADLARLMEAVGRAGGDFVATSPLHLVRNRGYGIGPYSPLSRFLRNPLFLDPTAVPELERSEPARALLRSPERLARLAARREAATVDHEGIAADLEPLLDLLFERFLHEQAAEPDERGRAFLEYRRREGALHEHLAAFVVLARLQEERGAGGDWRRWPSALHGPSAPGFERFRKDHERAIERELWVQFELERQLALAVERGARAGLALGLIDDLAVGAPHDSADAWALGGLVAGEIELGAPPDAFTSEGQAWGLAPFVPQRLRAASHAPFVRLVQDAMRHAGALRIDHVLGLFRAFWIPRGRPAAEGVYLRQPTDELLAILAVESRRRRCLVVGEDLGVVPEEVPHELASWGMLSTRVLLFEREGADFRAPHRHSPRAFLSATTHDLVPLRGWVEGADLELRARLGVLPKTELAAARAARKEEVRALGGFAPLKEPAPEPGSRAWIAGVHAGLASSAAPLVAFALDDLFLEREPVNLPGVPIERHRSWSRRMGREVGELALEPGEDGGRARS